mmetsp:Transcript_57271/g.186205  ORF Transcript_57271/g.186205 Transcript_57271/m.186205 type:complete len:413 (-) Transcript_57271:53-1291(-)
MVLRRQAAETLALVGDTFELDALGFLCAHDTVLACDGSLGLARVAAPRLAFSGLSLRRLQVVEHPPDDDHEAILALPAGDHRGHSAGEQHMGLFENSHGSSGVDLVAVGAVVAESGGVLLGHRALFCARHGASELVEADRPLELAHPVVVAKALASDMPVVLLPKKALGARVRQRIRAGAGHPRLGRGSLLVAVRVACVRHLLDLGTTHHVGGLGVLCGALGRPLCPLPVCACASVRQRRSILVLAVGPGFAGARFGQPHDARRGGAARGLRSVAVLVAAAVAAHRLQVASGVSLRGALAAAVPEVGAQAGPGGPHAVGPLRLAGLLAPRAAHRRERALHGPQGTNRAGTLGPRVGEGENLSDDTADQPLVHAGDQRHVGGRSTGTFCRERCCCWIAQPVVSSFQVEQLVGH